MRTPQAGVAGERGRPRWLVTGGTGRLGRRLVETLVGRGEAVASVSRTPRTRPQVADFVWDLSDANPPAAIAAWHPTHILHTAALTDVDYCERNPSAARALHVGGTERILELATRVGARVLYVSTDAVFNGERGRYRDTDPVDPINVYARTKAEGERVVLLAPTGLVVRLNMIGPEGLTQWILSNAVASSCIRVFTDVVFNPVEIRELAALLVELARGAAAGVCHVGSDEAISKADYAERLVRYAGLTDRAKLERVALDTGAPPLAAPRPRNTSLVPSRIVEAVGPVPRLESAIRLLAAEWGQGLQLAQDSRS